MFRIMPAFLLLAAFAVPASAAERRYSVTDFDRVQIDGPFQVKVSTGKAPSALAAGSTGAIDRVSIEVQGRTLRVRPNRSAWGGYPGEAESALTILVSTHELRGASVTGSGTIDIDKAKTLRFDAAVSGSGRVGVGAVDAEAVTLGLLGAGQIAIGGKAKSLRATIQGSGDLLAEGLIVDDARLNADTSGTVDIGIRRTADITATGPGDVRVMGKPLCTVKQLGSGRVRCSNK